MKKTLLLIIVLVMLIGASKSVDAAPSVNGSTGLINMPTADVLRPEQFSLGFYSLKNGHIASFNMNLVPRLEVGVTGQRYNSKANLSNHNFFNAKYALTEETVLTPGIAVGIEDVANTENRSYYVSASKGLIWGTRIHVGMGSGRYGGAFAAIEKTIKPVTFTSIGVTSLIAEWDGNQLNYGVRMTVSPGLRIDAGMRKHHGYWGVSFTS